MGFPGVSNPSINDKDWFGDETRVEHDGMMESYPSLHYPSLHYPSLKPVREVGGQNSWWSPRSHMVWVGLRFLMFRSGLGPLFPRNRYSLIDVHYRGFQTEP